MHQAAVASQAHHGRGTSSGHASRSIRSNSDSTSETGAGPRAIAANITIRHAATVKIVRAEGEIACASKEHYCLLGLANEVVVVTVDREDRGESPLVSGSLEHGRRDLAALDDLGEGRSSLTGMPGNDRAPEGCQRDCSFVPSGHRLIEDRPAWRNSPSSKNSSPRSGRREDAFTRQPGSACQEVRRPAVIPTATRGIARSDQARRRP